MSYWNEEAGSVKTRGRTRNARKTTYLFRLSLHTLCRVAISRTVWAPRNASNATLACSRGEFLWQM